MMAAGPVSGPVPSSAVASSVSSAASPSQSRASLARAIRVISVQKGHDPRDYTLIAFGGAGLAVVAPLFGVDVAGRAGVQPAHAVGLAPAESDAEVEHAQHAVVALVQVGGFDVAVDHALAVQQAEHAQGLHGGADGLHRPELLLAVQQLLQRFNLTVAG